MARSTLPIRTITRLESVATSASIARATLDRYKAERSRRAAVLIRQASAREAAE